MDYRSKCAQSQLLENLVDRQIPTIRKVPDISCILRSDAIDVHLASGGTLIGEGFPTRKRSMESDVGYINKNRMQIEFKSCQ